MPKKSRATLVIVLIGLILFAGVLYLWWKTPPEIARLLPESDAIVYVSLRPLRAATHFDRTSVARSATYQQFIDLTGIVAERDLDSAAFALHRMSNPNGANGVVAYSEVFQGRFDAGRLDKYLDSAAAGKESYSGRTIYAIPSEGRTLRIAILGHGMIAASNTPTPEQIHSILDRERSGPGPFTGNSLLAQRYSQVPSFASIWGIGLLGLPFSEDGHIQMLGLQLPIAADTPFVASVQGLRLKIDQITLSDGDALQAAATMTQLLKLIKVMQPETHTPEALAIQEFVKSIAIEQKKNRAEITAVLPGEAIVSAFKR